MPTEPAESNFKNKVRATAYPCVERGGIIWAYMGPRATPPPLPDLEAEHAGRTARSRSTSASATGCRRSRATSTPSTRPSCTSAAWRPTTRRPGTWARYALSDRAPRYEVADTDFGVMYGAYRPAEADSVLLAHRPLPVPVLRHDADRRAGPRGARARLDADGRRAHAGAHHRPTARSRSRAPPAARRVGPPETLPNTTDWYGRFRCAANADNDYLIDRKAQQKNVSYTGIDAIFLQDQAVTESMGADLRPHAGAPGHAATRWSSAPASA